MKVTSSKTFHLTQQELKTIISEWLWVKSTENSQYYRLFTTNNSTFEFDRNGDLTIIIDGEIEEYNSEKK